MMTWQQLEKNVASVAQYLFERPASPETINGVKVDTVLKVRPDYYVLIEVTQERTLDKLRLDLAKFASVRPFLMSAQIYSECYFVTHEEPPPSLRETGRGHNVTVLTYKEFAARFFEFESYRHARESRRFGSAVNPTNGAKDTKAYVDVKYIGVSIDRTFTADDLVKTLRDGKHIILLGNYGTGKSRCVQELFARLSAAEAETLTYPLAIDLRDNWGTRRANEVLQRHFDDLGLSHQASAIIKTLDKGAVCLLLDGFDEIGSQTWSDNPLRLTQIRMDSLAGVRDLISRSSGPVLISGREHYFNSNAEMFKGLGLSEKSTLVVQCADEFSDQELRQYLEEIAPKTPFPEWLPKRPLVCQIIADMGSTSFLEATDAGAGEAAFWRSFIDALCEREARIHVALDGTTIRRVLRQLARATRTKPQDVGPISIQEINRSFERVTGLPPADESAVMLQRLPALGRLGSESTDRHFVDGYILDGLRSEDVRDIVESPDVTELTNQRWTNPLRRLGLTLLTYDMATAGGFSGYHRVMKQAASRQNGVLAGDLLAGLLMSAQGELDLGSMTLEESHLTFLDLSTAPVTNLRIRSSVIDELDITECRVRNVTVEDCIIRQVIGVSSVAGIPPWLSGSPVEQCEAVTTVSRIRKAKLSAEQRVFVTLVKKLFFQPGAGRMEDALLRGLGATADKKAAEKILNMLRTKGMVEQFRGKEGSVYAPDRKYAHRLNRILTELSLSNDPLWVSLRKD